MSNLREWIEAALHVADSEGMPDSEVIPTWPADLAGQYPALTVGALREWRSAQVGHCEAVYFYRDPVYDDVNQWREIPRRTYEIHRSDEFFEHYQHRILYADSAPNGSGGGL